FVHLMGLIISSFDEKVPEDTEEELRMSTVFYAIADALKEVEDHGAYAGANFTLSPAETLQSYRSKVYKLARRNAVG
ncbi:MAG: hypothetical protein R6U39_08915, partial [Candidatus Aegiribacteria sp.]